MQQLQEIMKIENFVQKKIMIHFTFFVCYFTLRKKSSSSSNGIKRQQSITASVLFESLSFKKKERKKEKKKKTLYIKVINKAKTKLEVKSN